ncbi:Methylmalonyl-CoA mutase [Citrobacter freundii]|nr:Methylmalonyl-CoA mutase [Citrobacter freundii]
MKVRNEQIASLQHIRATRDNEAVKAALSALTHAAQQNENLLAAAINAARVRATLGEISDALEAAFNRYLVPSQCVTGVIAQSYHQSNKSADEFDAIVAQTEQFLAENGRRPRILIAKMGQDGHDRGAKVIASAYSDLGFDVDLSPMFSTPEEIARLAVENDVHVVGASSLAAGHKTLIPELIAALKRVGTRGHLRRRRWGYSATGLRFSARAWRGSHLWPRHTNARQCPRCVNPYQSTS